MTLSRAALGHLSGGHTFRAAGFSERVPAPNMVMKTNGIIIDTLIEQHLGGTNDFGLFL